MKIYSNNVEITLLQGEFEYKNLNEFKSLDLLECYGEDTYFLLIKNCINLNIILTINFSSDSCNDLNIYIIDNGTSDNIFVINVDNHLYFISQKESKILAYFELIYPFISFLEHKKFNLFLIVQEANVTAFNHEGLVIWSLDTDIITNLELTDNILQLNFFDDASYSLDVQLGSKVTSSE